MIMKLPRAFYILGAIYRLFIGNDVGNMPL